jgi:putative membrane protein
MPNAADPRANLARQRTNMASYRTMLALDRTTLGWVRTALTMASFGFGMVAFFRSLQEQSPSAKSLRLHQGAIRIGTALLVLGIVATVLAGYSHWFALRRLQLGELTGLEPVALEHRGRGPHRCQRTCRPVGTVCRLTRVPLRS